MSLHIRVTVVDLVAGHTERLFSHGTLLDPRLTRVVTFVRSPVGLSLFPLFHDTTYSRIDTQHVFIF